MSKQYLLAVDGASWEFPSTASVMELLRTSKQRVCDAVDSGAPLKGFLVDEVLEEDMVEDEPELLKAFRAFRYDGGLRMASSVAGIGKERALSLMWLWGRVEIMTHGGKA